MTVLEEIKRSFNRGDNMVRKLIIVNIACFVLTVVVGVISWAGLNLTQYAELLYLPADLDDFVLRPFSLLTSLFINHGPFQVLFNLLVLWYMGSLMAEYLGNMKLLQVYLWGGIAGGLTFIVGMNLIPQLRNSELFNYPFIGSSGAVLAVTTGLATLLPNYTIRFFFVDLKLKYIALALILLSLFALQGKNVGGNLAHLGGALFGFLYVRQIQRVTFLDKVSGWIKVKTAPLFKGKKDERKYYKSYTLYMKSSGAEPRQEDIDAVLDKINSSGYDSLTRAEREILFKASQQD